MCYNRKICTQSSMIYGSTRRKPTTCRKCHSHEISRTLTMIKKDDTTLWKNEERTRISNCFNTNDHGYALLVENTPWSFPHS
jgi:hypothetical protein